MPTPRPLLVRLPLFTLGFVALLLTGALQAQNPLEWILPDRDPSPFRPGKGVPSWPEENRRYSLRATERGEGTLGMPGPNRSLEQASVTLSTNGKASFVFQGERAYRFSGTWQRGRAHEVIIRLDRTFDRSPASGGGTLTLDGRSFSRIDLKGNAAALGGNFNARFQVSHSTPDRPRRFSLDATERGEGSIGMSGPNIRLSEARAILEPDGDVSLIVSGERRHVFSGAWSRHGRGPIDLHLTRGPDRGPMEATGTLTLADQGFSRIEVLGHSRSLGGRVRLTFERGRSGGRDEPDDVIPRGFLGRNIDVRGEGSLGLPGPNRTLRFARVRLDRRGGLSLDLWGAGRDRYAVEGRWLEPSADRRRWDRLRIPIQLTRLNRQPASSQGHVIIENQTIVGIETEGRSDSRRESSTFRLTFRADAAPSSESRRTFGDDLRSGLERWLPLDD